VLRGCDEKGRYCGRSGDDQPHDLVQVNHGMTHGFRRHAGYAHRFVNLKDFALMYGFLTNEAAHENSY
jgi:hypothetical protein